jgi:hypothetical protein
MTDSSTPAADRAAQNQNISLPFQEWPGNRPRLAIDLQPPF